VSARSYLSIGDVLTLLRQEFPDVTISKIRFLESQGLVNPERTPSGYRKFYEHDVERLRWVLRQQREHFLPLKVIKDRLDEDVNGASPAGKASPAGRVSPAGKASPAAARTAVADDPAAQAVVESTGEPVELERSAEPVLVGQRVSGAHQLAGSASSGTTESGPRGASPSSGLPGMQPAPIRGAASTAAPASMEGGGSPPVERAHRASLSAQHVQPTTHTRPSSTTDDPANGSGNGSAIASGSADGSGDHAGPDAPAAPSGSSAKSAPRQSRAQAAAAPVTAAAAPGPAPASAAVPTADPGHASASPSATAVTSMGGMGGASLSLDELCTASGLRAEYVAQLQEYGLIRAAVVGGAEYFDEEALTVANVAAKFAAFGIEARHLRLYKNAADREAGFIEQIVIPMVRQRNPEARARAGQTADELAALGQQLKGSLLRTGLRDLLNG